VPAIRYDYRWLKCAVCDIAAVKEEVAVVGRKRNTKRALGGSNLRLGALLVVRSGDWLGIL